MSELPIQIESLLKKHGKKLERIVIERSEEDVQKHKAWAKRIGCIRETPSLEPLGGH